MTHHDDPVSTPKPDGVTQTDGARATESEPTKPRRFYHRATTVGGDAGFQLHLDDRPARTPGKRPLAVPSRALGEAIAGEWSAQATHIDPATMPLTRIANTVIDGVVDEAQAVRDEIVRYAASDLLCYRAEAPSELVVRQAELWDAQLTWAETTLGARLSIATGVMPVTQPDEAISRIADAVAELDAFVLGPAHIMTTLTGSTVLALAVLHGALPVQDAWSLAHVDEDWQISQWGEDQEAAERRARRWREMETAHRFATLATVNT